MSESTIEVTTPDGPMGLYGVAPDRGATSAVIVIQEAFGVNAHIRDVTRRVADAGYHAVAPILFHRAGGGSIDDYSNIDFNEVFKLFEGVSDDGVVSDVDATLEHLYAQGFTDNKIGIVGFCFGGRTSFLVAARRALGASVGFYGGGIVTQGHFPFPPLIDEAATLKTPWLGLFGDDDEGIPVADVEQLRDALQAAPVDTEVVRYEGAGHGFNCDVRASFHPEAAADAWKRMLVWFQQRLG
jgi:carboxymethylenebutenolidase